jgi:hypothetical protein
MHATMTPEVYRRNGAKYVQKALERMRDMAQRKRIDPEASLDSAVVAQAVRGGGKVDLSPPMPSLSHMSDKEFDRFKRENFGF